MQHMHKQNIEKCIAENADERCGHGSACLIFHGKEGKQLLTEDQTGDANGLPQKIAVQCGQLLFIGRERSCPVEKRTGDHQGHGDNGN